jgi:hypothetical protein
LIRKANELFNKGEILHSKRIFLTVGYTDGIIRIGDYYYKKNDFLNALQMYILAPDRPKADKILEKMAQVVQHWIKEE